jgi:hypothetical protein
VTFLSLESPSSYRLTAPPQDAQRCLNRLSRAARHGGAGVMPPSQEGEREQCSGQRGNASDRVEPSAYAYAYAYAWARAWEATSFSGLNGTVRPPGRLTVAGTLLAPSEPDLTAPMALMMAGLLAAEARGRSVEGGGVSGGEGAILEEPIQDGDSLDTLIRMADEHRPRCEWAVCPADEREHPELTAQKRDWVHLKWTKGRRGDKTFAVLHRLDYNVWHTWLQPSHLEGQIVREKTAVRLTRDGVSYEMALRAVFQAMDDEMPENFRVAYLRRRPETEPLRT